MFLSPDQLIQFLLTACLITIAPGPDVLATLSLGLSRGWRVAVGFGVGCGSGCLLHTGLAVLGISAVLQASPVAYGVLKLAGAGYLAWLGLGALRSRGVLQLPEVPSMASADSGMGATEEQSQGVSGWFMRGLLANAVNPKVALFFLSFLPPFVSDRAGNRELQLALLGVLFTVNAVVVFGLLGMFSGQLGSLLQGRAGITRWLDRFTGLLFWVLAGRLLFVPG